MSPHTGGRDEGMPRHPTTVELPDPLISRGPKPVHPRARPRPNLTLAGQDQPGSRSQPSATTPTATSPRPDSGPAARTTTSSDHTPVDGSTLHRYAGTGYRTTAPNAGDRLQSEAPEQQVGTPLSRRAPSRCSRHDARCVSARRHRSIHPTSPPGGNEVSRGGRDRRPSTGPPVLDGSDSAVGPRPRRRAAICERICPGGRPRQRRSSSSASVSSTTRSQVGHHGRSSRGVPQVSW